LERVKRSVSKFQLDFLLLDQSLNSITYFRVGRFVGRFVGRRAWVMIGRLRLGLTAATQ
jgi:hypothetical protein